MKCPSCQIDFSAAVPQCPKCKLTLAQLDRKFGIVPHYARYLTDRSGELSSREIDKLRGLLRLFERKFPQLLFSVLVANLGEQIKPDARPDDIRDRIQTVAPFVQQDGDPYMVVDPDSETAALIVGYGLEEYLSEQDLENVLAAASNSFRTGDFARGIRECIESMIRRLRELAINIEEKKTPGVATNTQ